MTESTGAPESSTSALWKDERREAAYVSILLLQIWNDRVEKKEFGSLKLCLLLPSSWSHPWRPLPSGEARAAQNGAAVFWREMPNVALEIVISGEPGDGEGYEEHAHDKPLLQRWGSLSTSEISNSGSGAENREHLRDLSAAGRFLLERGHSSRNPLIGSDLAV